MVDPRDPNGPGMQAFTTGPNAVLAVYAVDGDTYLELDDGVRVRRLWLPPGGAMMLEAMFAEAKKGETPLRAGRPSDLPKKNEPS